MDNKVIEKARLLVEETKNKKIVLHIHFLEKDKKMPFPQLKLNDTSLNNTDVEVERMKGNVISIKAGDKFIYPQGQILSNPVTYNTNKQTISSGNWNGSNNFSNQNRQGQTSYSPKQQTHQTASPVNQKYLSTSVSSEKHTEAIRCPAKAPYNFIPLNDKVVDVPAPLEFNKYYDDKFTGFIDIHIDLSLIHI